MSEEDRAAAFRAEQITLAQRFAARQRGLAGSSVAFAALFAGWAPKLFPDADLGVGGAAGQRDGSEPETELEDLPFVTPTN